MYILSSPPISLASISGTHAWDRPFLLGLSQLHLRLCRSHYSRAMNRSQSGRRLRKRHLVAASLTIPHGGPFSGKRSSQTAMEARRHTKIRKRAADKIWDGLLRSRGSRPTPYHSTVPEACATPGTRTRKLKLQETEQNWSHLWASGCFRCFIFRRRWPDRHGCCKAACLTSWPETKSATARTPQFSAVEGRMIAA